MWVRVPPRLQHQYMEEAVIQKPKDWNELIERVKLNADWQARGVEVKTAPEDLKEVLDVYEAFANVGGKCMNLLSSIYLDLEKRGEVSKKNKEQLSQLVTMIALNRPSDTKKGKAA